MGTCIDEFHYISTRIRRILIDHCTMVCTCSYVWRSGIQLFCNNQQMLLADFFGRKEVSLWWRKEHRLHYRLKHLFRTWSSRTQILRFCTFGAFTRPVSHLITELRRFPWRQRYIHADGYLFHFVGSCRHTFSPYCHFTAAHLRINWHRIRSTKINTTRKVYAAEFTTQRCYVMRPQKNHIKCGYITLMRRLFDLFGFGLSRWALCCYLSVMCLRCCNESLVIIALQTFLWMFNTRTHTRAHAARCE